MRGVENTPPPVLHQPKKPGANRVKQTIRLPLRSCSHEPGTVNYPGVMTAPMQVLPRVHMMICCPGSTSLPRDKFKFI